MPLTMPKLSFSTLATGARQLVVQEALEITWCLSATYSFRLMPTASVMSGPLAGAEISTFLAPPWSMCARALGPSVNTPVDSRTISAPVLFQLSLARSFSAVTRMRWPSTTMWLPSMLTVPAKRPWTESYLRRCASVVVSVRSLMATISTPSRCGSLCQARTTQRPMRPKPLMPMRTAMGIPPRL